MKALCWVGSRAHAQSAGVSFPLGRGGHGLQSSNGAAIK